MGLFKQNTESVLMNKLVSLKHTTDGWSAVILKTHLLSPEQKRDLRTVEAQQLFLELMEREAIVPYFCRDGEIFFIFRGARKSSLEEIKQLICKLFPQYSPDDVVLESFFDSFLLSERFDDVYAWARKKEMLHEEEQKKLTGRVQDAAGNDIQEFVWSDEAFTQALKERASREAKTFLVVEDDEILRDLARSILSEEFHAKTAEDGRAALEYYNIHAPDVVFLDINMPGKNGIELLGEFLTRDPQACIIMFSSNKTSDIVTKALDMGAQGYVVKPFTPNALLKYARKFV